MEEFAHLRVHSTYTLSEGASKVEDLVACAKGLGIPALALTDRDNLFGAMVFSKAASYEGVQPIVGCQLHMEFEPGKRGNILLLAQDEVGYGNLCNLLRSVSDPRPTEDGGMANPEVLALDADVLRERSAGLILLTGGGADGLLPKLAAQPDDAAAQLYRWLLSVFGDRLYVEICRDETPDAARAEVEDRLIALAYGEAGQVECDDGEIRSEAPLVATSDVWYAERDRHDAWMLLGAVVNKSNVTIDRKTVFQDGRERETDVIEGSEGTPHHLRSADEMRQLFADLPEAYANAANVARRCAFMVRGRKPILPLFPCEGGRDESEELDEQARIGLTARLEKAGIGANDAPRYRERLEYELRVIRNMGFPGYFLIVSDFIKWAKARDIPVGPGRGSGAGSMVAWALTITDLDPLEFDLLFERFLNPDRISMPDFDIDFCQDRRSEVIAYVKGKYGTDRVASIATFGYIKSKTALKDLQRILVHEQLGVVSFGEANELTNSIPKKEEGADPMGLKEAYDKDQGFRERIDGSDKLKVLWEQGRKIEGLIRTSGVHAAGVVIGDRSLDELVPITYDAKSMMPVAGFDMKGVEAAGLVKFDFLGLTTLSVMQLTQQYVREFRGIDLDLASIPRNDAEVYRRLADGQCTGVFQFEGGGMRKTMRDVRPDRFEDLIAIVALFRPGPMDYIPDYVQRKAGASFEYPGGEDRTRSCLEETYGIMVYQEQVMQVAQNVAGYSLGGADLLRRAMGKKDAKEMARQRRIFVHGDQAAIPPVAGAVGLGMTEAEAEKLFEDILPFANYGFNKSHAAAYAWIGYQTAWLKVHYPAEYLSALMTYYTAKPDRLSMIKDELDFLGVPLLPPCVNRSHACFRPEPHPNAYKGFAVRFGLGAIKGISAAGADLAAEREANGPFTSIEDFHRRVRSRYNKAHYEHLSEAGAFDELTRSRRQACDALAWLATAKDKSPKEQNDLFGGVAAVQIPSKVLDVPEWGDVAEREFKSVGFYFSRHPIDPYIPRLTAAGVRRRASFTHWMIQNKKEELENRKLCAMITDVQVRTSSRGTTFVKAFVAERGDSYGISCFENRASGMVADDIRRMLDGAKKSRRPVVFECSLSMNREGTGVWVNARGVWDVDEFLAGIRGDILIRLDTSQVMMPRDYSARLTDATEISGPGSAEVARLTQEGRRAAADRALADLRERLETYARSTETGASAIRIETPDGIVDMPGRYKLSMTMESTLRGTPGVISIKEMVEPVVTTSMPLRQAA